MTVQELITALERVEDKALVVCVVTTDQFGRGIDAWIIDGIAETDWADEKIIIPTWGLCNVREL